MKLTKYLKINFVILKIVEISLLCLVPFWVGKFNGWLYEQTGWFMLTPMDLIWLDGVFFIAFFATIMFFAAIIIMGAYCLIKQNMKWAKKLTRENDE